MKTAFLTLLLAGILCPYFSSSQIFYTEQLAVPSCIEKNDVQLDISVKAANYYRGLGPGTDNAYRFYNFYAGGGWAFSKHFTATVSYENDDQDGNIYITGNADKYGVGDRGRYTGNRISVGGVFMQRVAHSHYIGIYINGFTGRQERGLNSDDKSGRIFKTSFAGFNFCPAYGVKAETVDFSIGPRLTYQQFYNGKAESGNVVNAHLLTAGFLMDLGIGYRWCKLNIQTGAMGMLTNDVEMNGGDNATHYVGFYTNIGAGIYIGKYYKHRLPVRTVL